MTKWTIFDDRSHEAVTTTIDNQGNVSVTRQSRFDYERKHSISNSRHPQRTWKKSVSVVRDTQKSNILQFRPKSK